MNYFRAHNISDSWYLTLASKLITTIKAKNSTIEFCQNYENFKKYKYLKSINFPLVCLKKE